MLLISGLVDDWRVQRCRNIAACLDVEYEVRPMLEAAWEAHLAATARSVGGRTTTHSASPLVLLRGNQQTLYVGGLDALEKLAAKDVALDKKQLEKQARALFSAALLERHRKFAFLDVRLHVGKPKKVILELFDDVCPRTCDRFLKLCASYRGCKFHRVVPDGWIQTGNIDDAVDPLPDESFVVKFDRPGIVAMANAGRPHSNGSQFFITVNPLPWLDNSYVAFAAVVKGMPVVRQLAEHRGPIDDCVIASAGAVSLPDGSGLF